jgi:hypothetical protein
MRASVTRRERLETLTALLTEPTRGRVRAILERQRVGQIDLGRDTMRGLVRERLVSRELALLVTFEAAELLAAGSVRIVWGERASDLAFAVQSFPSGALAGCSLSLDDVTPRGKLWVAWGQHREDPELGQAVKLLAREIARHLGLTVEVCDVRP